MARNVSWIWARFCGLLRTTSAWRAWSGVNVTAGVAETAGFAGAASAGTANRIRNQTTSSLRIESEQDAAISRSVRTEVGFDRNKGIYDDSGLMRQVPHNGA